MQLDFQRVALCDCGRVCPATTSRAAPTTMGGRRRPGTSGGGGYSLDGALRARVEDYIQTRHAADADDIVEYLRCATHVPVHLHIAMAIARAETFLWLRVCWFRSTYREYERKQVQPLRKVRCVACGSSVEWGHFLR